MTAMPKLAPIKLPEPDETGRFNALDPLDSRYFDSEIAGYLSERSRIAYQAHVEAALAHTLAEYGICTFENAQQIEAAAASITAEEVYDEEQTTRHDIKALSNVIKSKLPAEAQPYVHFGATSYDIIATASALQLRDVTQKVILHRLQHLQKTLLVMAEQYATTPQIGRTHGQHAVPITFGYAIALYVSRLGESLQRLERLSGELYGKFSGAVGAYNALSIFVDEPIAFEKTLLSLLDLKPAPHSTQIIPAENMVRLLDELSLTAGIMANLSHDMRHLQRTEIAEVRERFEKGQTGSSTMAHKRNPWNFENIISMWKQVTAQTINSRLNVSSEHQRDLTDSASSRFYNIIPASVASMAERLNRIMGNLEVDEANMQRNLAMTEGAIAAEPLYLLFAKYGHTQAHELSKEIAHRALAQKRPFKDVILQNNEAANYWQKFTAAECKIIEEPEKYYTGQAEQKTRAIIKTWCQA
jgi:adenylosuccinate lyase